MTVVEQAQPPQAVEAPAAASLTVDRAPDALLALLARPVEPEQREPLAKQLLALLDDTTFGHEAVVVAGRPPLALRHHVVEAVLRLGYPWALQLEPDDLTAARAAAHPQSPWRRRAIILVAGLSLAAAAVGASAWAWEASLSTTTGTVDLARPRAAATSEFIPTAASTAAEVKALRTLGRTTEATGLAEACVAAFTAPAACLTQLAELGRLAAASSDDTFDTYRARQWLLLADQVDHSLVRERARVLFETDVARRASLLPPSSDDDAGLLMFFVQRALRLEAGEGYAELEADTRNCTDAPGQVGLVCRAFREHARKAMPTAAFPPAAVSTESRTLEPILDLLERGELDEALQRAEKCAQSPLAPRSCAGLTADLYAARARRDHNSEDLVTAGRWKHHAESTVAPPAWRIPPRRP